MKKLLTLLLVAQTLFASELLYEIKVKNQIKGALTLSEQSKALKVDYHKITKRDKIAFFAPRKEVLLTKILGTMGAKEVKVDAIANKIKYDLSHLSEELIEYSGISQDELKVSAIIIDKQSHTTTLDKLPIHTMESFIYTIFIEKKLWTKPFYLYEPQRKMLIKVVLKPDGSQSIKVGGKSCEAKVHKLFIHNRKKVLARIYTNPYPVMIEAASKSWSFTFKGSKNRSFSVLKAPIYLKHFAEEKSKTYDAFGFKVLKEEKNIAKLSTTFSLEKSIDDDKIQSYAKAYLAVAKKAFTKSMDDDFVYKVSKNDVKSMMKKRYKLIDFSSYKKTLKYKVGKTVLMKIAILEHPSCRPHMTDPDRIQCGPEDEKVDLEKYVKEYLTKKYGKYKNLDVDEEDNYFEGSFVQVETFTNTEKKNFTYAALMHKYPRIGLDTLPLIQEGEDTFSVHINKQGLADFACNEELPLAAIFKSKGCKAVKTIAHKTSMVNAFVKAKIYKEHPLLNILNVSIQDKKVSFDFTYRGDLGEVNHACN